MTTKKVSTPSISISLSILSIFLLSIASGFSPNDNYLLNCGSTTPQTLDSNHRTFSSDSPRFTSTRSVQLQIPGPTPSPLYNSARAFHNPIHYTFKIIDIGSHHFVRLHFYPNNNNVSVNDNDTSEAQFSVIANGFLLLHDFRIPKTTVLPIIKEFVIPVESREVDILFVPSTSRGFGFVNAIEVISAPNDLVSDVGQFVGLGKNVKVGSLLRNGFETIYRVNVGGFKVTPFNDSLWRTWVTDDEFLSGSGGSDIERVLFGGRIKYRNGGASREVGPDNVYNSGRVIRSVGNVVPEVNITWRFEVEKGYSYMVRTHFCDIVSAATNMLYFNVYVNGNLAYENLDLSEITSRFLASPFYADFVVDEVSEGVIEVSIGPSNMSLPRAADGILNGVEIWKMNNTMGSFGGEVCAEFVRRSWRRENGGVLIPFVALVVFLMLAASMFMQRKKSSSAGWSRLPVDVSEANFKFGDHMSSTKV